MCNKGMRYIFGLLLVVLLIGIDIHTTKACEPGRYPWFLPNFKWDETNLPEGIELIANERYMFVNNTTAQMAWIINDSQHDLLLETQRNDRVGNTNTGLDELVQTLVSQEKRGINIPSNPRGYARNWVQIAPGSVSGLPEEHSKSMMSNPPPPNVEIPNGKVFNVVLVHQQEIYPIRVTMFYSINTGFRKDTCGVEPRDINPVPWIILLAVAIVGAGLYLWSTES